MSNMIRHFFIFLLLVTLNANAIAGSLMMIEMSTMTSHMSDASEMTDHHMTQHSDRMSMSAASTDHCQMQPSDEANCEDEHSCGLCTMHSTAALIPTIAAINGSNQFSFEPNYQVNDALSIHSPLLKPPKSA